jgi:hypothetical protein
MLLRCRVEKFGPLLALLLYLPAVPPYAMREYKFRVFGVRGLGSLRLGVVFEPRTGVRTLELNFSLPYLSAWSSEGYTRFATWDLSFCTSIFVSAW